MKVITLILAFALFTGIAAAQTDSITGHRPFGVFLMTGTSAGLHSIYTGILTNWNDKVILDCGGGLTVEIGAQYTWKSRYEVAISLRNQNSVIFPAISNGTGEFDRDLLTVTGRYYFRFGKRKQQQVNAGFSVMEAMNPRITFDFTQIEGRGYEEFEYKRSAGGRLLAEYEIFPKKKHWSFGAGMEYSFINYNIKTAKFNHGVVPLSFYPGDGYIYHFSGNNFGVYESICYSFGKL